jgi:patatin-related protein
VTGITPGGATTVRDSVRVGTEPTHEKVSAPAEAQVGGGAVELAPVPEPPRDADVRELRLALVCYGGVSLAIYMHGVAKELQKLVAASAAYATDQTECPWEGPRTERAYWQALKRRERNDPQNVRTRVVIDIIAGTSAGGINGIALAKALAHDLPQEPLRSIWLERSDVRRVMTPAAARVLPFLPLKLGTWMVWSALKRRASPPLDGDLMFKWILEALGSMDAQRHDGRTLMPPMHTLELFVTVTDLHGYSRRVPIYDPKRVSDLRHRHALVFSYGPKGDHLDGDHNPELAFAARATSSFPGAFAPITLSNIEKNVPGWAGGESFRREAWSIYALSNAQVERAYFVDGGVLDNFPFRHAIDAIRTRPAALEVDRRLVYIEPHPEGQTEPPSDGPPTLGSTVWAGLSRIPRREPVLDDLLAVRELNDRVERVRDIVRAMLDKMPRPELLNGTPESYASANAGANEAAAQNAGLAYATYLQLKLHSVVERFAALVCEICGFPLDSNQAFFVRDSLVAWARTREILMPTVEPTDPQLGFLRDLDLDYAERRIRFVIKYISGLYHGDGKRPPRGELNAAKQRLYEHIAQLADAAIAGGAGERGDSVRRLFDPERLRSYLDGEDSPEEAIDAFVGEFGGAIDEIQSDLRGALTQRLADFGESVYATLLDITESWDDEVSREVLARYIGFPLWDALIFPLQAVADLGELNPIEVVRFSPEDVKLLRVPGQKGERPTAQEKLKGVAAGHFAAFFSREKRENDYLWGRLDAAERIVGLLVGDAPEVSRQAFTAILDEEESDLTKVRPLLEDLRRQVEA